MPRLLNRYDANASRTFQPLGGGWLVRPLREGLCAFRLVVSVGVLLLVGCNHEATSGRTVDMAYQITPQPVRVGSAEINLRLQDTASRPITHARVSLEADMAHAGMAPVFGKAEELDGGRYHGQINFTMPGDWVVLVDMSLPDGQKLERQIEVKGVGAK